MKIIKEHPLSLIQLKETLDTIKKRDKEPNVRVQKTEDYINLFAKISLEQEKKLREKITTLNVPRLKEEHITKIIDILPREADHLKAVLQGYTITVSKENIQKIIDVLNDVVKKK